MLRRTLLFLATLVIAAAVSDVLGWMFFGGQGLPSTPHIVLWLVAGAVFAAMIYFGWVDMGRMSRDITVISRGMQREPAKADIGERRPYRPSLN